MKKLIGFSLAILMVLSITPMILASPFDRFFQPAVNIGLTQKNPTDWSEINGAKGNVLLSQGDRVHAILIGGKTNTNYTLIYYGFKNETVDFNDVWNYATCITQGETNNGGNVRMKQETFNYKPFLIDGDLVKQKFWIVTSSDVDCVNHRMIAWNPNNYLFERRTI